MSPPSCYRLFMQHLALQPQGAAICHSATSLELRVDYLFGVQNIFTHFRIVAAVVAHIRLNHA